MKAHPALGALCHHHQLALILAQRIRGRPPESSESRPQQRDRVVEFLDRTWTIHLEAEEQFLFPLARRHPNSDSGMLALLEKQHRQLRLLATQLRGARQTQLENILLRFAHVLEEHIRKEEGIFFRRLQRDIPEQELLGCGRRIEDYFRERNRS